MKQNININEIDKKIDSLGDWQLHWLTENLRGSLFKELTDSQREALREERENVLPLLLIGLDSTFQNISIKLPENQTDNEEITKLCLKLYIRLSPNNSSLLAEYLERVPDTARGEIEIILLLTSVVTLLMTEFEVRSEKKTGSGKKFIFKIKKPAIDPKAAIEFARLIMKKLEIKDT